MYFRWTLFNGITLFVMALTIAMIWVRSRFSLEATWPLAYYALVIGYSEAFEGSLNLAWLVVGLACGLLLRFEFMGKGVTKFVRAAELVVFGYVLLRGTQLVLNWPW